MDMDVASSANARRDHRSDDWVQQRSTMEDEVPDHEAVENLLRPRAEIAEFSNLMGESNVDGEHSEGNVPDREVDDNGSMRSEDQRFTAVQKKMVQMT
jgi:hypothetical protein